MATLVYREGSESYEHEFAGENDPKITQAKGGHLLTISDGVDSVTIPLGSFVSLIT